MTIYLNNLHEKWLLSNPYTEIRKVSLLNERVSNGSVPSPSFADNPKDDNRVVRTSCPNEIKRIIKKSMNNKIPYYLMK